MADRTSIFDSAQDYLAAKLCVLPARRDEKRPAIRSWKRYQSVLPTNAELATWFASQSDALCIVCGEVSGNLEIIDFDAGGELFGKWKESVPK